MGCSIINISRLGGDCEVFASRVNKTVEINTSLICSINLIGNYVKVEPKYIWLTESNNFTEIVNVFSNTDWKIE